MICSFQHTSVFFSKKTIPGENGPSAAVFKARTTDRQFSKKHLFAAGWAALFLNGEKSVFTDIQQSILKPVNGRSFLLERL